MEITRVKNQSEFIQLMKLLDVCFPHDLPDGMQKRWCHVYTGDEQDYHRYRIIKDKDKIVCHVGIVPLELNIGNKSKLKVAGIGGVATDPAYRSKGLMKLLLKDSIKLMSRQGYDISWLAGDRVRYNYFGWENAGAQYNFVVTKRVLNDLSGVGHLIRNFSVKRQDLYRIKMLNEQQQIRINRDYRQYELLFSRSGKQTITAVRDNKIVSYLCYEKSAVNGNMTVFEHGGTTEGVLDLIKHCFRKFNVESLHVTVPAFYTKYKPLLFDISNQWFVNNQGMIKIMNLESLLLKYKHNIETKLGSIRLTRPFHMTLIIKGTKQQASFKINNHRFDITNRLSGSRLVLDEKQMVRLLFGVSTPSNELCLPDNMKIINHVFPVDFYMSLLETV
jgi:predicted acetyltransferase